MVVLLFEGQFVCLFYASTSSIFSSKITLFLGSRKFMRSKGGCIGENTRLRVDFRMWWLYPWTIASPSRCIVVIEGVGAL